jgi:hypothetical protein
LRKKRRGRKRWRKEEKVFKRSEDGGDRFECVENYYWLVLLAVRDCLKLEGEGSVLLCSSSGSFLLPSAVGEGIGEEGLTL